MFMKNLCLKSGVSRVLLFASLSLSLLSVSQATAAPFRYGPQANTKIAYKVEITADLPENIETSKGIILFEVTSTGETIKLKYSGGLRKTIKPKENASSARGRFGPPPFPRHFGFGNTPRGLIQTTNHISLTPRGKINSLQGDSQLPYVLGNLSILIFETLPENNQKSWTTKNPIAIFENSSSRFPGRHFPPFRDSKPDKTTAGSETASFSFQSDKSDLSTFRKTYRLHSAEDKKSINITCSGTWTFNHRLKVPESLDCKYNMVFKEDNVTLNLPITVKYHRISNEELAQIEKERAEQKEKSKAEREQRLAEQEAPIEGAQRRRVLADLKSNDVQKLQITLRMLSQKNARDDKEIARAIKRLLKHYSRAVRRSAENAIIKFAPELGRKIKLNKAYATIHTIDDDELGAQVNVNTPLPRGLVVAAKDIGPWYKAAKIIRKHENGQVEVEFVGFGQVKTIPWTNIRLAPPEVDQPFVSKRMLAKIQAHKSIDDVDADDDFDYTPAATKTSDRGYRPWTDNTGTFVIIAKYVKVDAKSITLRRKKDGKEIKVPLSRLCAADRKVVKRLKAAPKSDNPFE